MYKRPLVMMAVGFLLGILVVQKENVYYLLPAVAVWMFIAGARRREPIKWAAYTKLLLYTVCVLAGVYRCHSEQEFAAEYESLLKSGMTLRVQGKLGEKENKNNRYQYYLEHCYIELPQGVISCNQILVPMEKDMVSIGEVLVLEGEAVLFRQSVNEGNFDEAAFYQSQKIAFKLKNPKLIKKYGNADRFREQLYQLKQRLRTVYGQCMPSEKSGVLTQMTLGDKSLMEEEIKMLYQRVGISHMLAISGLHISVIGMGLYKLIRRICGLYWPAALSAGGFLVVYGCMTGFRPSAARAILMFFAALLADVLGRSYDLLSALSLAAVLLLWENTELIFYAGFLFSFAAVLGVAVVADTVNKTVEKEKKVRRAVYTAFSIQLVTLPLSAYFYYEIPLYSMPLNLLLLPFMSMILFAGLTGGMAGLFWLPAAKWLLSPCSFLLGFYQWAAERVQRLPYSVYITGKPEFGRMIVYYFVLFFMVWLIAKRKRRMRFGLIGMLLLLFVFQRPQMGMELSVLDVGQGDAIYLRTSEGQQLFIDGGSSDVKMVGKYRILPFLKYKGVQKIDYWFVSHTDSDHISGIQEILEEGYPVEHLVFAEAAEKDGAYENLVRLAEQQKTEVITMNFSDCLHFGEAKLTCVFPYEKFIAADKNAASLALYYEDGSFEGIFTGDIGAAEEAWIAAHSQAWLDNGSRGIDVYKAAHHGSRYSNGSEILEVLQPKTAVISCGYQNRYGHPHKEALERLKNAGSEIFYTMESGQITFGLDKKGVWVKRYR